MRKTHYLIVGILSLISISTHAIDSQKIAAKHPIIADKPVPGFFEGALLGNGALGVVVTTRPDAVCLHFGHNNVWDIRITENNKEKIGTFDEIFTKAQTTLTGLPSIYHSNEFSEYLKLTAENYHKPYPRPFPCGTLLLGFDRREVELLGHTLDISNGLCTVQLLKNGKKIALRIFTDMNKDRVWLSLTDDHGNSISSCFNRIRLIADPSTPNDIPHYQIREQEKSLGYFQRLPYLEPHLYDIQKGHAKDKAFTLDLATNVSLLKGQRTTTLGIKEDLADMERYLDTSETPFYAMVSLKEGLAEDTSLFTLPKEKITANSYIAAEKASMQKWSEYWKCSGVSLADNDLEKIWYRNLYFLNCSAKAGVTCPGIFANWSYGNIGTAWHGDYHLNYNTQQPFWVTYSSNHLDKNIPYVDLVHHLLPVSRAWAKEYYNMRGAFFPHSAYPVDMTMHPYPVPDWGWEVFETPWMVQGLWWHYLYSGDTDFLKEKAFIPMKDAVMFLVDYMSRPDAKGEQWGDHKYHIFPSVPPELYGLQPDFKFNYDTQIDIALSKFIFKAYLEAIQILKIEKQEKKLAGQVSKILSGMPAYPTYQSPEYGEIYVSVPGETDQIVYNVPANMTHVFPGEEYGMNAPEDVKHRLENTYHAHQNEGGNDIVFVNLQAARMGLLDLEKFKRQVHYATLPNQTVTDAVLQIGGRYNDQTDYLYMGTMGIWFENFALPVVINECLMQSYNGVIVLFPNWDWKKDATFTSLRARGAFLIDATLKNKEVTQINIISEKGNTCVIRNPWNEKKVSLSRKDKKEILSGSELRIKTDPGEQFVLTAIE